MLLAGEGGAVDHALALVALLAAAVAEHDRNPRQRHGDGQRDGRGEVPVHDEEERAEQEGGHAKELEEGVLLLAAEAILAGADLRVCNEGTAAGEAAAGCFLCDALNNGGIARRRSGLRIVWGVVDILPSTHDNPA